MLTRNEQRKIRARSLLNAKSFLRRADEVADQRASYRYNKQRSFLKKTDKLTIETTNDVIRSNNPNSPINRTKPLGT